MVLEDLRITSILLFQGALFFALIDAVYLSVLTWRIQVELFRDIKWTLCIVSGVVWFGIWSWAISNFWESVYIYVFPIWAQSLISAFFGLVMAVVGLGLWAIALRLPFHPVIGYTLSGGLLGVCSHTWAVYRGIVEKPPMLQGVSPYAVVVIAFFEFMFYWCVILSLSAVMHWGWRFFFRTRDISNYP